MNIKEGEKSMAPSIGIILILSGCCGFFVELLVSAIFPPFNTERAMTFTAFFLVLFSGGSAGI